MKNIFGVLLLVFLPGLKGINFAQPAPAGETQTGRPSSTNSTTTTTTACFQCGGTGQVKCTGPDCKDGMLECPGPCLKLSKGTWEHLVVAGHDPEELWQKFNQSDGSWQAWNQGHLGEVIKMQGVQWNRVDRLPDLWRQEGGFVQLDGVQQSEAEKSAEVHSVQGWPHVG